MRRTWVEELEMSQSGEGSAALCPKVTERVAPCQHVDESRVKYLRTLPGASSRPAGRAITLAVGCGTR